MTETSAAAASSEALRYSLRGARSRSRGARGASRTFSIHWLRSENRYADSGGGKLLPVRPVGRNGIEFFEAGPDKMTEAFAVEDADSGIGRELGEKAHQAVRSARRDDGAATTASAAACSGNAWAYARACRMACDSRGTRRSSHLGGRLKLDDVALVAARDDHVHSPVGGQRLLFHPPAVLAKEVDDEVLELSPTVRAGRVRIGKRGGHVFTLATLIIVAVVIIMAALDRRSQEEHA